MFVADNHLWQEWLHGRVVTNEHHMRQTTSFGRFFGTNTGKLSFCGVTTPFWSSWLSTMLVSSRFRRSAFCSDAATLANRVRCHCHDVRTWPRRRLGSKKLFFVFTVWGPFPAPFLLTATVLVSILGTFFVPKLGPGGAHKNVFSHVLCVKNSIWPQSGSFGLSRAFQAVFP